MRYIIHSILEYRSFDSIATALIVKAQGQITYSIASQSRGALAERFIAWLIAMEAEAAVHPFSPYSREMVLNLSSFGFQCN